MSRVLSTSNSELSAVEWMQPRVPLAAISFCLIVIAFETALWQHRMWFADQAAWYWECKKQHVANGDLGGEVAILGTSVSLHSLDPQRIAHGFSAAPVTNLALNGMRIGIQRQAFSEFVSANQPPRLLCIELRSLEINNEDYLSGPYFRRWATWQQFIASKCLYNDPQSVVSFAANRASCTLAYRFGVENWITESIRNRSLSAEVRDRNLAVQDEMLEHSGFIPGSQSQFFWDGKLEDMTSIEWRENAAGRASLYELVQIARNAGVQVVFYMPPRPAAVQNARAVSGYQQAVDALGVAFGDNVALWDFEVYDDGDFADDHHLNFAGSERFSLDFARRLDRYWTESEPPESLP